MPHRAIREAHLAGSPSPSHTNGFLFADLREYTAFVDRNGDQAGARLLNRYRDLVRAEVGRFSGAEIKTEGDSFFIVFPSASAAIGCALAIVAAARAATQADPRLPIRVGIGIHAGETAETVDGAVGGAINIAARVAAQAKANEVVVTDVVRGLTRTSAPYGYVPLGTRRLKGVSEPVPIFRVTPERTAPRKTYPLRQAAAVIAVIAVAGLAGYAALTLARPATTSAPTGRAVGIPSALATTAIPSETPANSVTSTPLFPTTGAQETLPIGRFRPAMVDIPGEGVLMFGGADGGFCCPFRPARSDMWQFGPAGGWTRIPGQIPIELDRRGGQSLGQPAYDPVTGKTWVHSNTPNGSQIWTYDPRTAEWNLPTTNPGLPGTISQSMVAFDSHSRQLIIFGGVLGAETGSDQTWSFDIEGGVFEQKNPPVNPPARSDAAMVYDVASDRVILVGGYGPSSVLDDTWAYDVDNDSWTEMLPSPAVPPIAEVAAAYEPSGQRIVLFGGTGPEEGRGELAETWTYVFNENAWIQLQPSGTPVRRTLAALAYDAETAVIILFGGGSTGTNSGIPSELLRDTWLYDPAASTWTEWRSP